MFLTLGERWFKHVAVTDSNSDQILQHLLQHIWSTLNFPKRNSKQKGMKIQGLLKNQVILRFKMPMLQQKIPQNQQLMSLEMSKF